MSPAERRGMLRRHVANPDDPPVRHIARGTNDLPPGPDYAGAPGRIAIVQGQAYIVGVILVAQLFLVTTALNELLSGNIQALWGIVAASFVGFIIALIVALWPRRRVKGY
jgi:hypothetical protein